MNHPNHTRGTPNLPSRAPADAIPPRWEDGRGILDDDGKRRDGQGKGPP